MHCGGDYLKPPDVWFFTVGNRGGLVAERSHLPFTSSSIYEALLFDISTLLPIASRFVFFPVSLIPVIVKLNKWKTLFLITVVADIVAGETSETKEDVVASHRRE